MRTPARMCAVLRSQRSARQRHPSGLRGGALDYCDSGNSEWLSDGHVMHTLSVPYDNLLHRIRGSEGRIAGIVKSVCKTSTPRLLIDNKFQRRLPVEFIIHPNTTSLSSRQVAGHFNH